MMPAIGIDRFRTMLRKLLEKSEGEHVEWSRDPVEKCYCVELEQDGRISVYHHHPPHEAAVAGALLHIQKELVITLEAEEEEDDWTLLSQLYYAAESSSDADGEDTVASIERQLESDEPLGSDKSTAQGRREVQGATYGAGLPSLEDLEDGDSPFDEET